MVESLVVKSSTPERGLRPLLAKPDVTSTSAGVILLLAGVMLFSVSDVLAKQLS